MPLVQAVAVAETAQATSPATVLVIPIAGDVDEGMAHLVDRAVDEADAAGEPLVIDVDTPGGRVDSAFSIRDSLFRATVPTVAFVSARAYSAGALITLAARTIVMAPGSSIGAAEPIYEGSDQSHQAKFVSALSAEFRSTAGAQPPQRQARLGDGRQEPRRRTLESERRDPDADGERGESAPASRTRSQPRCPKRSSQRTWATRRSRATI